MLNVVLYVFTIGYQKYFFDDQIEMQGDQIVNMKQMTEENIGTPLVLVPCLRQIDDAAIVANGEIGYYENLYQ